MRIGVDVGGTHTDAVILDGDAFLAATKTPTTEDIQSGIVNALNEVLNQAQIDPLRIKMVTIGTTQFTNAVVERRDLAKVAAFRIGAQSSAAMPVAALWPDDIKAAVLGGVEMLDGGSEYDGTEMRQVDPATLADAIARSRELSAYAITAVFGTSNPEIEKSIAREIENTVEGAFISVSHELGRLGLHQRENATLLNAALLPLARQVTSAFETAFAQIGLSCPLFMSQNDGTLMTSEFARNYPVLTFSSGPTNSMRGAAYLSKRNDAMVVDIGGTTSDIGMLINGFPRPSGNHVSIAGVRTNFRMPDTIAVGLGGGSIVSEDGRAVGPTSVGHRLRQDGLVFGGNTLTSTDIAVAEGLANIGDPGLTQSIPPDVRQNARQAMQSILERNIDRMKTDAGALPLIVVGGGAFLAPDDLDGTSETIRPEHAGVANAIGAAFAQVGGEAETIFTPTSKSREAALEDVKTVARAKAIDAGAKPDTVVIAEITETPMSYMDEPGAVIRMKAVGDVDLERFAGASE